jgi:hypothetical protein
MILSMNKHFTRGLIVVLGLASLNACTTQTVVEAPKKTEPVVVLPIVVTPVVPKPIPTILNIRPSVSNGEIIITETRNITTGEITRAFTSQPAKISFRAAPGSISGSILGYRITSQKIGAGVELIDPNKPISRSGLNVYIQSGFSCIPAPPVTQSCSVEAGTPANGLESSIISLSSGVLEGYMVANRSSASETLDVTFLGLDWNGKAFEIPVKGLTFIGQYNPAN